VPCEKRRKSIFFLTLLPKICYSAQKAEKLKGIFSSTRIHPTQTLHHHTHMNNTRFPSRPHKTAILTSGLLAAATLAAHAALIYSTGFEASEGYTGGTAINTNQLVNQGQGWIQQFGGPTNFDVYTYAGAQVPYTPSAAIPVIGGIPQLITPTQNPNGGSHFVGSGNQSRDNVAPNFGLITSGLVEFSVDYFAGEWFDNTGGNYNGGAFIRDVTNQEQAGFWTGRGSAQASGDVNGNGPWAPQWHVFNAAGARIPTPQNPYRGHIYSAVAGFDNLEKEQWYRVGMVYDKVSGQITQFKTQELIPGGNIYTMNSPLGPLGETLYIRGGMNTPNASTTLSLYNVGNGTLSGYDNLYLGDPYTWTAVVPEPSTAGLMFAVLSGLFLARRRK